MAQRTGGGDRSEATVLMPALRRDYHAVRSIAGPLVLLDQVGRAGYGELVEVRLPGGGLHRAVERQNSQTRKGSRRLSIGYLGQVRQAVDMAAGA